MFIKKHFSTILLPTAAAFALMCSCTDHDFGYTADELRYAKNFTDIYGEIPADKSWDLSSWANWKEPENSATRAGGAGTPTKGELAVDNHYSIGDNYYEVPQTFLTWLDKHLVEGNDNRFLGSSFVLKLPSNDFAIIPVYQGNSAIHSDLEIKINDYEITKIWTKSDGIQAKRTSTSAWEDVKYWDGHDDIHCLNQSKTVPGHEGKLWPNPTYHPASTIGDYAVQAKPIIFHNDKISRTTDQEFMYLSLKNTAKSPVPQGDGGHWSDDGKNWITDKYKTETRNGHDSIVTKMWDENNTWTTIGDRLTSINPNGYMLALNVPLNQRPAAAALAELLPGYKASYDAGTVGAPQALVIGCEDANGASSDHDINDIVFLIVGYPDIPQVIPTTQVIEKRYMCEDLGATDDFDFNDVVVDVKQTMDYELSYQPSGVSIDGFFNDKINPSTAPSVEITSMVAKPETKVQTARISHVCGTLPIQVQVGDYLFPWIMDPTDKAATRSDLMKGGWKFNGETWTAINRQTPTRAKYDVEPEGWNPNEERIVWGWDNLSNNIRVYVQWPNNWGTPKSDNNPQHQEATGNGLLANHNWAASNPYISDAQHRGQADFLDLVEGDRHVENVTFPLNGTVPYIIATDPDFPWMKERQDIMRKWLTDGKIDPNDPEYSHVAGPGSGAYYEILPGQGVDRAIIWSGKSGGERLVNGVEFAKGSSEQLGLKEAIEQGYNTINVYTSGVENGWVGLCYIDSDGSWKTLYPTEDADSYKADENVTMGSETWYKASIRLTQHQQDQIKANGFVIQSYTNALLLRALDLTKNEGYTVKLADPAVDTDANNKSIMGVITAGDHARERDGAETGGRIPFAEAMFINGENCVLTATPKLGYVFEYWSDDHNNTTPARTITKDNVPSTAITAHFHFQAPAANVDLASKYYHKWSSYKPGAHISSPNTNGGNNIVGTDNSQFDASYQTTNKGAVYGDAGVYGDAYADLSNSNVLVVNAPKGNNYRFIFNRQSDDAQGSDFLVLNTSEKGNKYLTVHIDDDNTNKTIIVDLAAIKADQGYVHLNCIKNAANSNHNVNWMKVDAISCDKDEAFKKLFDDWNSVRYGTDYSMNGALSFYNWSSDDANAHIIGNSNRLALQKDGDNGKTIAASGGVCATILGNTWNQANTYADLSNSDAHYMVIDSKAYSGVPRLWFNNQSLTFLANDPAYSRIYKGNSGTACHYVINLDKIRTEKGKVHLNAITTDYQNSCAINNVWVLQTCAKATAWEAAMTAVNGKSFDTALPAKMNDGTTDATVQLNKSTEDLFGNPDETNKWLDLSSAHWMQITLPTDAAIRKDIRLFFNNSNGSRETVDAQSPYVHINGNVWYVDLDAIKTAFGQVRLRAIKGPSSGTPATITSIKLDEYTAPVQTYYSVGIHHQVKLYGQSSYVETQSELNKIGNLTCTTTGTFYTKNGSNYEAVASKTVNLLNNELYYVVANTSVTFTLPSNADYHLDEANSFTNGSRISTIDHDGYTPYVKWSEKAPAGLQLTNLSQANITLNASTTGVDVAWTTSSNGTISCETPDYQNKVNIWRNDGQNSHHIVAKKQNGTFVVKIKQAATDTYKSAEIAINVTIENYWDNDNNAQIIPGTLSQSGDYQVYTCDISKMKSALPANCTTVKMYVKRAGYGATSWIVSNDASSSEWYKLPYWENNWLDDTNDSQFKWNNKQYSFIITMSKTDWDNIIGDHSFIMKSNVDLKYTVSIKGE